MSVSEPQKMTQTVVEIFKTNVNSEELADTIVFKLNQLYPKYRINFDLEDCDRVLRIESNTDVAVLGVIDYGKENAIHIEVIDY